MLAAVLVGVTLLVPPIANSLAVFTDRSSAAVDATADRLDPPTNVTCASGVLGCSAGLLSRPQLTWTATVDPYATGYRIYRAAGTSAFVQVGSVVGRTTTSWTDTTAGLSIGTTYRYVVRSTAGSWLSEPSNQVTVTILLGL